MLFVYTHKQKTLWHCDDAALSMIADFLPQLRVWPFGPGINTFACRCGWMMSYDLVSLKRTETLTLCFKLPDLAFTFLNEQTWSPVVYL